jgi:sulfate/thiosulfate transport system permease protein
VSAQAADLGRPAPLRVHLAPVAAAGAGVVFLSLVVLIPLAAVVARGFEDGLGTFWEAVTAPEARAAIVFTLWISAVVMAVNVVFGTLIAWVLVRDEFRGKRAVNALIDLPFALPTIVAGLTLLALYGPDGPAPVDIAFSRWAVLLALLFVTLPFVVRAVQPVLEALDREVEEAAASLGASPLTTFRRVILPALIPAIGAGAGLGFARALGEIGSVILISGNLPFRTEVASVFIFGRIESDAITSAAAVSVVLLVASLVLLALVQVVVRRAERHDG